MKIFTIEHETNNITLHATVQDAEAVANAERFRNEAGLLKLAAEWPASRLVEIWNGLPGVAPVKKFKDRQTAVSRIWRAIQALGQTAEAGQLSVANDADEAALATSVGPETPDAAPVEAPATEEATARKDAPNAPVEAVEVATTKSAEPTLDTPVAPHTPDVAPVEAAATKKTTATKKAPKEPKPAGIRGGSKTAQVVEMLKRQQGATLAEIMSTMGWQKHTVRGFVAGAMKKAGYTVESFKPEGGERTYRINP